MKKICLDAGVITQYISDKPKDTIVDMVNRVIKGEFECYILSPVFVEVYYQVCKMKGIEFAQIALSSFSRKIPHTMVNLDEQIITSAGIIKCQHRASLSYIDCISIGYCLNNNIEFHTTEKTLKQIKDNTLDKLKVKKYRF